MKSLNIETEERKAGSVIGALKASVINQIKELFTDVQELYWNTVNTEL
jgi:hypothetical protein